MKDGGSLKIVGFLIVVGALAKDGPKEYPSPSAKRPAITHSARSISQPIPPAPWATEVHRVPAVTKVEGVPAERASPLLVPAKPAQAEGKRKAPPEKKSKAKEALTDAAIIAALIATSIAAYRSGGPGPCACPDDRDRGGRRCGRRSAHSRAGGWKVLCYPSDVSAAMISAYRKQKMAKQ